MATRVQQNPGRRRSSGAKFFFFFVPGLIFMLFINIWLHAEHYGRRGKDNKREHMASRLHANTSQPVHWPWGAGKGIAVSGEAGGSKLEPISRGTGRDSDAMRGSGEEVNSSTTTTSGAGVAYHLLFMMYPEMPVRALCTVESLVHALKDDAGSTINMWVDNERVGETFMRNSSDLGLDTSMLRVRVIEYQKLFRETPLQAFYPGGALDEGSELPEDKYGRLGKQNLADALRFAILWHYGGMYMDTDIIVIKNPAGLPEGFPHEGGKGVYSPHALRFSKGDPFLMFFMHQFVDKYMGKMWGYTGPRLLARSWAQYRKDRKCDAKPDSCTARPWHRNVASVVVGKICRDHFLSVKKRNREREMESLRECTLMHTHNHFCGHRETELLGNASSALNLSLLQRSANTNDELDVASLGKYGQTWVGELRHHFCPSALKRILITAATKGVSCSGCLVLSEEERYRHRNKLEEWDPDD